MQSVLLIKVQHTKYGIVTIPRYMLATSDGQIISDNIKASPSHVEEFLAEIDGILVDCNVHAM